MVEQTNGKGIKYDISFPTWKSLIHSVVNFGLKSSKEKISIREINSRLKQLDTVANTIHKFHPSQIITILSEAGGTYFPDATFEQLLTQFRNTCIAENQFYSVYDVKVGWHTIIDPNIVTALGIGEKEFSLPAMAGLDPKNPLYHPEDVNHMIRWASLGYLLLSFPGFKWTTLKSYYYVAHRVGTKLSRIDSLREREYVTLEKRCFPLFCQDTDNSLKPIFHFDQWSVLDCQDFDYVKPRWITSPDQNDKMNGFFYLLNAYLLNVSPKHIAMLNERQYFDRNKAVANSMNKKIKQYSNLDASFDEIQVGNSFTKTIRPKITNTMNIWDKRVSDSLVEVDSDQKAVHYAKALGLLPIPKHVEKLLYSSVTNLESDD